jgi:hypothetical protein
MKNKVKNKLKKIKTGWRLDRRSAGFGAGLKRVRQF